MKKLLLILGFTLLFGTTANANSSIFKGKLDPNPSYSDCAKAIEKGVVISIKDNGAHVFFYNDKIYTIRGGHALLVCIAREKLPRS